MLTMLDSAEDSDIMQLLENSLYKKIGGKNDYRNFLHLYEVPLIRAGMKKFKSQLQLSDRLGLNRNTLRKKIAENRGVWTRRYLEVPFWYNYTADFLLKQIHMSILFVSVS